MTCSARRVDSRADESTKGEDVAMLMGGEKTDHAGADGGSAPPGSGLDSASILASVLPSDHPPGSVLTPGRHFAALRANTPAEKSPGWRATANRAMFVPVIV
jgi:hypothetical protein